MEPIEKAAQVQSKADFLSFLRILQDDFADNRESWQNKELADYLEAMEAFVHDSGGPSIHQAEAEPSWAAFAKILAAASVYE